MAQCKLCSRSGWFLKLTENGLCSSCAPMAAMDIHHRCRIISDSVELVNNSKNLDTRLSRLELLIEHCNALLKFEKINILPAGFMPSSLIEAYGTLHDQLISETINAEVDTAFTKASVSATHAAKINALSKVLLKVKEYIPKTKDPDTLVYLEKKVTKKINDIQFEKFMSAAQKAEFKKQIKKALDQYYEALYFLKHDSIDDYMQTDQIKTVEKKIVGLGGKI